MSFHKYCESQNMEDLETWCKFHKYHIDDLYYNSITRKIPIEQFTFQLMNLTYNSLGIHWMVCRPCKRKGRKWIQYDKYEERDPKYIHFSYFLYSHLCLLQNISYHL